jgi:hypothetical protein
MYFENLTDICERYIKVVPLHNQPHFALINSLQFVIKHGDRAYVEAIIESDASVIIAVMKNTVRFFRLEM